MLIAGSGSALTAALADEAARRGIKTALSLISGQKDERGLSPIAVNEKVVQLDWNPCSPISARSLVLAAENRNGPLDTGLIVCAADDTGMRDFSPAGIDFVVNNHIKSYMFLANELSRHFSARRSGALAFVLMEGRTPGILSAPVFSAFKSFSGAMIAQANTEYVSALAFSCEGKKPPPVSEYAAYIFKILGETQKTRQTAWFKFSKLKMSHTAGLIRILRDGNGGAQPL
ncbi:MAG: hypothetical protein LBO04_00010 [Spirochaetaceae bacterium]|jgi:NAD(P)-dependent dehydrogenase (short-subunit alcohol dehydrogenase family)|nr:hypothetical protein [Spirochaetaceae bacterium]